MATKIELVRQDELRLLMTIREEGGSRSLLKILGDSQLAQLIDIANSLLPERSLFPQASERHFIDNNEFDIVLVSTDLYYLKVRNGVTSYDQFDLTEQDLRDFIDAMSDIRTDDNFVKSAEIGPAITSAVAGPTGPTGPAGPTGPTGKDLQQSSLPVMKYMTDDVVISSEDLVDLTELGLPVGDGEIYQFDMLILLDSDDASDFRMAFSGPVVSFIAAAFSLLDDGLEGPNGPEGNIINALTDQISHIFGTSGVSVAVRIVGIVQADTGGIVIPQVGLNSGSGAILVAKAPSFMSARKVN